MISKHGRNESPGAGELIFYVQASREIGMGHLTRSAAVSGTLASQSLDNKVVLRADRWATLRGKTSLLSALELGAFPQPTEYSAVVIDAPTLPKSDLSRIAQFPKRILISPVCDRAEVATHVLVRSASQALRRLLAPNCIVIEDNRFAYATCSQLTKRHIDFHRPLRVGICLSGGAAPGEVDQLVDAVSSMAGVAALYLVGVPARSCEPSKVPLIQRRFSYNLWEFLGDVDVFVTGDGVMVAEAVAQGIPCLSLCAPNAPPKNISLVEAGCIAVAEVNAAAPAVRAFLDDRNVLMEMHRSALAQPTVREAGALAGAIAELCQGGRN